mmetsp:Transcript_12452/g.18693  ORF Transcript_12452/g.18693 Transcript_12452/m.18693 type:complete len:163 (+) Transcript_12452:56-544(+)
MLRELILLITYLILIQGDKFKVVTSEWSECDPLSCNRTRLVICSSSKGEMVDPKMCGVLPPPISPCLECTKKENLLERKLESQKHSTSVMMVMYFAIGTFLSAFFAILIQFRKDSKKNWNNSANFKSGESFYSNKYSKGQKKKHFHQPFPGYKDVEIGIFKL